MTYFMKAIFTRVSICSLHISEKCFLFKCIFIKLSVSVCFPTIIKRHKKNGPFILFLFCDSRVIIVTYLPSFESADSEFYFITGGNVVRGDRTVMQMKSLRDHPDISYGSSKQWKQLCEKYCFNCCYRFGA